MFSVAAFTMFIAITFPFFGGLLGFFGGLAFAPTTYFVSHILPLILTPFLIAILENRLLIIATRSFNSSAAPLHHVALHLQTKEVRLILVD